MRKRIPKFKSEDKEREYWAKQDSTEVLDWKKAKKVVLPNLKPSVKTISLRLPESMLEELKLLANKRDVPYQSLLKIFLSERIDEEPQSNLIRYAHIPVGLTVSYKF
jgi:predicted DNA binding CopG/RHH family protein